MPVVLHSHAAISAPGSLLWKNSAVLHISFAGEVCATDLVTWAVTGTAANVLLHVNASGLDCVVWALGTLAASAYAPGETIIVTPSVNGVAQAPLTFTF